MNNDYEYNGSNEVYPSYAEVNNFKTNNINIKPPNKKRKWPIILLVLLLVIVGLLIYLTFFTDKLDFIKSDDKYSEFDPNKGKIEKNSNEAIKDNKPSNSNKYSNKNIEVSSVSITPTAPSMVVGSKITLKATVMPSDAKDKSVIWKSSDNSIATINSNGIVTGIKAGTVTITATSKNGKKATVKVVVTTKKVPVTGIKLNEDKLVLSPNIKYLGLKATITPTNATNQEVIWSSSNNEVAYIEDSFLIVKKEGTAIITATTKDGNYKASCTVIVKPQEVTSITMSGASTVYIGKTIKLDAWSNPVNSTIYWKSSDTSVATVSSSGVVTGVKAGKATITAYTSNKVTATKKVEVMHNAGEYSLVLKKQQGLQHYNGCYSSTIYRNGEIVTNYNSFVYNNETFYKSQPICPTQYNIDTAIKYASINFDDGTKVDSVSVTYK